MGVGQHPFDCQDACEQHADSPGAFVQDGTAWVPITGKVRTAYRLPNPVSYLPGHDDGIVIELPSPPEGGSRVVEGTLTFGIGGADLDRLGASDVLRLDSHGRFTTVVDGKSFPDSYVDSGTETYLIGDVGLPRCPSMAWAYCAEPRRTLHAQMVGGDGEAKPVRFAVGDIGRDWSGASVRRTTSPKARDPSPGPLSGERHPSSVGASRSSWTA